MYTVKKDKVIKPRNLIKNDVVLKTYKIYNYKYVVFGFFGKITNNILSFDRKIEYFTRRLTIIIM